MKTEKNEKLVISPLHDSKGVSQVLANDACREILDLVTDEPLSSKQMSDNLGVPLNNINYNIKKLAKAGLIKVDHARWSQKGRKVNYYAPAQKFIVIVPKFVDSSILRELKRMLPIGSMVALGGAIAGFATWAKVRMGMIPVELGTSIIAETSIETVGGAGEIVSTGAMPAPELSASASYGGGLWANMSPVLFYFIIFALAAGLLVGGYFVYRKYWGKK